MFNLFHSPIEKSSLSAWSKLTDDIAKVAILAMPVILYSEHSLAFKGMNIAFLLIIAYVFLAVGRFFRQLSEER
ncbi:hypothetical protein [Rodentibacter pneumotropicus]|uniref:Uncharacterized protein n=1 Tax=Rodentibacter pneumotropicus TaxID=758 RepID=A0A1V3K3L0_9PAST|nr:hypothetical protein [Rodentibacter pneumotropicus]MCQ9120208.1 hypothetical protein [Rodentibacter pneumotropicus]OOF67386.1 hypothetical protein BKG95_07805 [Rodentibacter pneumotropicus]THA01177.1 hypothetical protein D3M79_02790 [Rodentibacter pneumotropicus]THA02293.1 hypothetical protein D3M74_04290 [Rodentibacter pneumotropicus]THA06095.1 hypothetical protein D3M77_08525 [Rodentibacter pneumotropicus]